MCLLALSGVTLAGEDASANGSLFKHVLAAPFLNPDGVEVKLWLNREVAEGTPVKIEVGKYKTELPFGKRLFLPLPGAPRWTPDTPNMLKLRVTIGSEETTAKFGLRRLEAKGEKLFLNGEPFYMRGFGCDGNGNGRLYNQVTSVEGYRNYVKRAKEFGFNTMRSHMWENNRPEEFMDACDELGLCFWPEFPLETEDISKLTPFWNHPSVILWCWGNEMGGIGSWPWVQSAYKWVKEADPSRLIQDNSGWGQYDRDTTDIVNQHMGYYFPYGPRANTYSSYALFTAEGSIKGKPMEQVMQEMRDGKFRLGKPLIAHETGNHMAFPDVIRREARMNFSQRPAILAKMNTGNRLAHLQRWIEGSTKFKQEMDKLWMEQVRKSPLCEGYEMWMLSDHGYAFSGVIEDGNDCKIKPFISSAHYRVHNAPDVLLADFPDAEYKNFKRCFVSGEKFKIKLLASVYGSGSIKPGKAVWKLTDGKRVVATGKTDVLRADRGRVSVIGDVGITLPKTKTPLSLELSVQLSHTKNKLANSWNVWVFPKVQVPSYKNVLVVKELTDTTIDALANGARVLLKLEDDKTPGRVDQPFASCLGRFRPQIWEYGHNLGAYIPSHPSLKGFPNAGFSDLQFYRIIDKGRKIILDDCPFAPEAIVDAVDLPSTYGVAYCRKATYLFELSVGKGKLLVTGFNFSSNNMKHIEVQTIYKSIMDYASSDKFLPKDKVDVATFRNYVRSAKANPNIGDEGHWIEGFYKDNDTKGWNKFVDSGEEPPVVKPTASPVR